jgi:uncharacterized membrane protein
MRALALLDALLVVAYPVAIFYSLGHFSPRTVGLVALALVIPGMLLRARRAPPEHLVAALRVPLSILSLLLLGAWLDDARFVLALPVLVNLALLAQFAGSLRGQVSMVERFARMQKHDLSSAEVAHCRQATLAWCALFVLNGGVSLTLALLGWTRAWAIWTGAIAYALMGTLFAAEYVLRKFRFREYGRGLHDRALAKLWPPREGEP